MELPPTPAADPKKKWTRARVPRVRTGCATCKKRHLKCDEERPHCQRCKKDRFECEGYPPVPKRKYFAKDPKSNPAGVLHQQAIVLQREEVVLLPRPHTLSISISRIPIEIDLLHHVRTSTLREFSMALNLTEFWEIHVIPLAHAFEPIKYALCALGGAHKCFKYKGKKDPGSCNSRRNLEQVSIQLYNQAIHHIASMDGTKCHKNMEIILTCCVIFISIENILGRYHEGLRHLKGGSDLITSYRNQSVSSGRSAKQKSSFFDDIGVLMSGLAVNSALYSGHDTVPQIHLCVLDSADTTDPDAPFSSMEAVARELNDIETEYSARIHLASNQAELALALQGSKNDGGSSSNGPSENESHPFDACVPMFRNWNRRFDAFRNNICERELSRADRYRLKSLELEKKIWEPLLELPHPGDSNTVPRKYCEDILQAVDAMIDAEDLMSSSAFLLEAHIIPAVCMVCSSSADEDIQRKSIQILRSLHIREGVWESQDMANVLEKAMIDIKMNRLDRSMLPWNMPSLRRAAALSPLIRGEISNGTISADDLKPEEQPEGHVWEFVGKSPIETVC